MTPNTVRDRTFYLGKMNWVIKTVRNRNFSWRKKMGDTNAN
jgi:hypothetical protein